jgi:sec-independent protein translocase protein TatA
VGLTSPTHLIVLVAVIMLLFGAKRVPELTRGFGKGIIRNPVIHFET